MDNHTTQSSSNTLSSCSPLFGLNTHQLAERLQTHPESLAGLTPDVLRRLCENSAVSARLLGNALRGLARQDKTDGPSRARVGFLSELSELEWLAKLSEIAKKCELFEPLQFDDDEPGYANEVARLHANLERQNIKRRAASQNLFIRAKEAPPPCIRHDARVEQCDVVVSPSVRSSRQISSQHSGQVEWTSNRVEAAEVGFLRHSTPSISSRASVRLAPVHTGSMVISNLLTRCALGTIGKRGVAGKNRPVYTPEEPLSITRVSGYNPSELVVSYAGQELAIGELETWSALLKLAAPANLGGRIQFWSRDVLAMLHRGDGGSAYRRVREEIHRLQGGVVTMRTTLPSVKQLFKDMFPDDPVVNDRKFSSTNHPIEVSFGLLGPASTDGSRWSVVIPREVALAFSSQMTTWFKRDAYFAMKTDVARRLFLFYVSHPAPWPFTLHELAEFVGSTMSRTHDLREQMKDAHAEMQSAGFIGAWSYGVSVKRRINEEVFDVSFAHREETLLT